MLQEKKNFDDINFRKKRRRKFKSISKYSDKLIFPLFNSYLTTVPVSIFLCLSTLFALNNDFDNNFVVNNSIEEIENSVTITHNLQEMANDQLIGQGEIIYQHNGKKLLLPLLNTDVKGSISGYMARVFVTQTFINSTNATIEALYTFPLPENSAVDSMVMTIGDKRIKGIIKERGEARAIYEQARRDGKTASLLEQQRPNIFLQQIANILKNDTIKITISYVQEIDYSNGEFLFNFPMVVGPRYVPGNPIRPSTQGTINPTDQVPDADKISPPIVPQGLRSGHNISLIVDINGGTKITDLLCESHKIKVTNIDSSNYQIKIAPNDNIPNKDFILKYKLGGKEIRNTLLTNNIKGDGFFQLTLLPQISIEDKNIMPRELIFIVDNSGSMNGFPIDKCKELMKKSLQSMKPFDKFNILKFAGHTELMSQVSLSNNEANITKGLQFIDNMTSGGGTEMMSAINKLFTMKHDPNRKRLILFLTDGYVGNEKNLFTTIRDHLKTSRVFTLGVGSSVNHYLLKSMSLVGGGAYRYIRQDGNSEDAVNEFYRLIDSPLLTNVKVNISGITTTEILPKVIPDLFSGAPLSITGRYKKGGTATIAISGDLPGGKKFKRVLKAQFPNSEINNSPIKTLWARRKISQLELYGTALFNGNSYTPEKVKEDITKHGLDFKIMSQYTSFVAVNDAIRDTSGKWISIEQAVEMAEGVSYKGIPNKQIAHLSSVQMKSGGGRKGAATIGFGAGGGSTFSGGSGNVESLISGLMGGSGGSQTAPLIKRSAPKFTKGGAMTGGRSRESIIKTVKQNMPAIRYAYNKRLRLKPDLKGKITIKFAVDEFGKVIFIKVLNSTMNDPEFEKIIIKKIKYWIFGKIDKPGDVTEIVYPFVFSK